MAGRNILGSPKMDRILASALATDGLVHRVSRVAFEYASEDIEVERLRAAWSEVLSQVGVLDYPVPKVNSTVIGRSIEERENPSPDWWKYEERSNLEDWKSGDKNVVSVINGNLVEISVRRELSSETSVSKYSCQFSYVQGLFDLRTMARLLTLVHLVYRGDETGIGEMVPLSVRQVEGVEGCDAGTESGDLRGLYLDRGSEMELRMERWHSAASHSFQLSSQLALLTRAFLAKHDLSLDTLVLTLWHQALAVFSNGAETVVGLSTAGRCGSRAEQSRGYLLHAWKQDERATVLDTLKGIESRLSALDEREMSHWCPCDSSVIGTSPDLVEQLLTTSKVPISNIVIYEALAEPLSLSFFDNSSTISFSLRYADEILSDWATKALLTTLQTVWSQIASESVTHFSNLSLLNSEQQQLILRQWNETEIEIPRDQTVVTVFEDQVLGNGRKRALIFEGVALSYDELNSKANCLSRMVEKIIKSSSSPVIALYLERNELMIVAILAVLKAGGVYVPLATNFPHERVEYILKETRASGIITSGQENGERADQIIRSLKIQKLHLDSFTFESDVPNLGLSIHLDDLAYIIYTSGSTGTPKGVMLDHASIMNRIIHVRHFYGLRSDEPEVILQPFSYVFSAFIKEFILGLCNGGTLVLTSENIAWDPQGYSSLLRAHGVTHMMTTPSLLQEVSFEGVVSLKRIAMCGEPVTPAVYDKVRSAFSSSVQIINDYGNAECQAITAMVTREFTRAVGYTATNRKVYVLDSGLRPVPVGALGEICVSGVGLTRGYVGLEEGNSLKFIPSPFESSRMYRTGDLGRWLPDGCLDFIGRNDFQVKVRGYRIELGEIESVISSCPGIKESVVVVKQVGELEKTSSADVVLVAYFLLSHSAHSPALPAQLDNYLKLKLPSYMIPSLLIPLSEFPKTPSGKLDRKALPWPAPRLGESKEVPVEGMDAQVARLWERILGLPSATLGLDDNFFQLGGNSLLGMRLINAIRTEFQVNATVDNLFQHSSLRDFVSMLKERRVADFRIPLLAEAEEYAQSLGQDRVVYLHEFENGAAGTYNYVMSFKLRPGTEIDKLEAAICAVVTRHEVLRTLLKVGTNGCVGTQVVLSPELARVTFQRRQATSLASLRRMMFKDARRPFDIHTEIPIKLYRYEREEEVSIVTVNIHHVAFDRWSQEVFLKDLTAFYHGRTLAPLPVQYKDFGAWQRAYLEGEKLERMRVYWKGRLNGYERLHLHSDFPRPLYFNVEGASCLFEIGAQASTNILSLAKELRLSLFSVLLSGFVVMLSAYTGQEDITLGVAHAGRSVSETEDMIGFFVNTVAVRVELKAQQLLTELMRAVFDEISCAHDNSEFPLEELVRDLGRHKDSSRHPIFQIIFHLRDAFKTEGWANLLDLHIDPPAIFTPARFELVFIVHNDGGRLSGSVNYSPTLYSVETVGRYCQTFAHILEQMGRLAGNRKEQTEARTSGLQLVQEPAIPSSPTQHPSMTKVSSHDLVHKEVEDMVSRVGHLPAILAGPLQITYKELNQRANSISQKIKVPSGTVVAFIVTQPSQAIIAILAIWKAGAAFVAIPASLPKDEMSAMLRTTQAQLVLVETHTESLVSSVPCINIDDTSKLDTCASADCVSMNSLSLSHIVYSSDLTQFLKVSQAAVWKYLSEMKSRFLLGPQDQVLETYSWCQDEFLSPMLLALTAGATLVIHEGTESLDTITHLDTTPSFLLNQLDLDHLPSIRTLVLRNEVLSAALVSRVRSRVGAGTRVFSYFSVTPTSLLSLSSFVQAGTEPSLGHILETWSVVDSVGRRVPVGGVGELVLRPVGIRSIGADSAEELSTGRLVRVLRDGQVEYVGMKGGVVRLNGDPVDVRAVAKAVLECGSIKQCLVEVDQVTDTLLVHYTLQTKGVIGIEELEAQVRERLPASGWPITFVHLPKLRLNDRLEVEMQALAQPQARPSNSLTPTSDTEQRLCSLFGETLGLGTVEPTADFFSLGGDSLKALRLLAPVRRQTGLKVTLKQLFTYRSVRRILETALVHD